MGKFFMILVAVAAAVALFLLGRKAFAAQAVAPATVPPPSPATTTAAFVRETMPVSSNTPMVELPPVASTMGGQSFTMGAPQPPPPSTSVLSLWSSPTIARQIAAVGGTPYVPPPPPPPPPPSSSALSLNTSPMISRILASVR